MAQPAEPNPPNLPIRRYRLDPDQHGIVVDIEAVRLRRRKAANRREVGMTTGQVRRIIDGIEPPPEGIDPRTISAIRRILRRLNGRC